MTNSSKSTSSTSEDDSELRRGPWTLEEDTLLIHYISHHGEGRWNLLAKRSGLRRTGKSCRLRWLNYLKPDVKRGNLTPQEQLVILQLHSKWGNRWSKIAQHLPGRTDNEIKNYWRTRVQKQARLFKIDTNSTTFQDIIRCFWMPRLLQKIEDSSSPGMLLQSSAILQPPDDGYEHSAAPATAPTQVPGQGPLYNLTETTQSLDHLEPHPDSENCTNSSISSSESLDVSRISQLPENPSGPFHAMVNNDYEAFVQGCYFPDNSNYDMEAFNMETLPALASVENSISNYPAAERNWADNDWSMEGLWQLRN